MSEYAEDVRVPSSGKSAVNTEADLAAAGRAARRGWKVGGHFAEGKFPSHLTPTLNASTVTSTSDGAELAVPVDNSHTVSIDLNSYLNGLEGASSYGVTWTIDISNSGGSSTSGALNKAHFGFADDFGDYGAAFDLSTDQVFVNGTYKSFPVGVGPGLFSIECEPGEGTTTFRTAGNDGQLHEVSFSKTVDCRSLAAYIDCSGSGAAGNTWTLGLTHHTMWVDL